MASRKTKRVVAVTALSASLVIGGAAAYAQTDGTCVHGKGKGMGTGAPSDPDGTGKGLGATNGWWHKCAPPGNPGGDDHGNPGGDDHGNPGGDHGNPGGDDHGNPGGNPGGDHGNPGDDDQGTSGTGDQTGVNVGVTVQVDLPDAGSLAHDAVEGTLGILQPTAQSAVGQVVETADQAHDLAQRDVAGIVDLLGTAKSGVTSLSIGSVDAGVNVAGGSATGAVGLSAGTSGVTSLGNQLLGKTFNLVGGTTTGLMGIVAGMTLPF